MSIETNAASNIPDKKVAVPTENTHPKPDLKVIETDQSQIAGSKFNELTEKLEAKRLEITEAKSAGADRTALKALEAELRELMREKETALEAGDDAIEIENYQTEVEKITDYIEILTRIKPLKLELEGLQKEYNDTKNASDKQAIQIEMDKISKEITAKLPEKLHLTDDIADQIATLEKALTTKQENITNQPTQKAEKEFFDKIDNPKIEQIRQNIQQNTNDIPSEEIAMEEQDIMLDEQEIISNVEDSNKKLVEAEDDLAAYTKKQGFFGRFKGLFSKNAEKNLLKQKIKEAQAEANKWNIVAQEEGVFTGKSSRAGDLASKSHARSSQKTPRSRGNI